MVEGIQALLNSTVPHGMPLQAVVGEGVQRHKLEHCHAKAEHVSPLKIWHNVIVIVENLSCHVLAIALTDLLPLGEYSLSAQPKISKFVPPCKCFEDILWFDIKVHNLVLVQLTQRFEGILKDAF